MSAHSWPLVALDTLLMLCVALLIQPHNIHPGLTDNRPELGPANRQAD